MPLLLIVGAASLYTGFQSRGTVEKAKAAVTDQPYLLAAVGFAAGMLVNEVFD